MDKIRLGFHVSIAGSVANAPKEAVEGGYSAFQIFTTSSRSWKNSIIGESDKDEFVKHNGVHDLEPFAHIPYLCNPATTNNDIHEKSKLMLISNIRNCHFLGIECLVIHLGSHLGGGMEKGIENICNLLGPALDSTEKTVVLLENGAGYRNSVGSKFDEIGKIIDTIGSDRLGLCFDTCHAFAAGYDLRSEENVDKTMEELGSQVKLSRLRLIHLNDAKHELGSGLDRHWHIGKGSIGSDGFISIFKNRSLGKGPFIIELPEDEITHRDDMRAALSLIKKAKHG